VPDNNRYFNIKFKEIYIFSICIRTKIYKKTLNKLGEERFSRYMLLDEDPIAKYILFNIARSIKYISKFGYIYVERPDSVVKRFWDKINILIYKIFMLDDLIVFAQNFFKHKKILATFALYCLKIMFLKMFYKRMNIITNYLFLLWIEYYIVNIFLIRIKKE